MAACDVSVPGTHPTMEIPGGRKKHRAPPKQRTRRARYKEARAPNPAPLSDAQYRFNRPASRGAGCSNLTIVLEP